MIYHNPPHKRHLALQPFSRDHYYGLMAAQRLVNAADGTSAERHTAIRLFLEDWVSEIEPHFVDEERFLLPLILNASDSERFRYDHAELRLLAKEAKQLDEDEDPGSDWCLHLGELLGEHIRWEEKTLFKKIQDEMSEMDLQFLAVDTCQIDTVRGRKVDGEAERA